MSGAFLRFCAVGVVGFLVDVGCTLLLTQVADLSPLPARIAAFIVAAFLRPRAAYESHGKCRLVLPFLQPSASHCWVDLSSNTRCRLHEKEVTHCSSPPAKCGLLQSCVKPVPASRCASTIALSSWPEVQSNAWTTSESAFRRIRRHDHLKPIGLHFHLGTGIRDVDCLST